MDEEDLRKKLKILEDSFNSKFIKKEEYAKEKKELKDKLNKIKEISKQSFESLSNSNKFDKKKEEISGKSEEITEKNISDKIVIIFIIIIIIFFIAFFSFKYFFKPKIMTIDDLHLLNLQGKLKPEQGYVYKGFSFVRYSDLWHTQVQVGNILIDIPLHYGPRDLENIPVEGNFNTTLFDSSDHVFMTFNPLGDYLTQVALATGEIDRNLIRSFGKAVIGSCDRNETEICKTRDIITCDNTEDPVVYIKEANETKVILNDNCLAIQGRDIEIIKAADKLLMRLYGII